MDEVKEEAIIDEVTEEAIIICLSVRNKCFSEETDTGRELGRVENLFLEYLIIVIFTPGSRQISRWVLIKGNPGHWQMRSVEAKKPLEMISIFSPRVAKCNGYDGYIRVKILASWG